MALQTDTPPLLYAEDPEWADVVPVPQYENVNPLAPIFYTAEYKDATDYFRAVVKAGEMSPRVLALTEKIIKMNPAHYTAWQYRYKTLLATGASFEDELRLMDVFCIKFLKTYQVWHHRRLLVTHLVPAPPSSPLHLVQLQEELDFIARCLNVDTKNYHTWSYRQWLLAYFNADALWRGETKWVERMLAEDVRNNSAWHHRFFVVFGSGVRADEEDREGVVRREVAYTKQKLSLAPNNASAWNYLRGVLDHNRVPYSSLTSFVQPYTVPRAEDAEAEDVLDLEDPLPSKGAELPCVGAIEFLADVYEQEGSGEGVRKATELWKSLANEYDTIRKKYWEYRIREALAGQTS
ncbi:protein prenylyltransferase [Gloeophyllum trabeum ATCC 11539]|uniref:Protein farnesyltransferase/geranylgeranyltransferase type-1 subunit alpha n=1 Tax=Gloeophyllum trabeum (strain ATCC 11539 / FP-39264 / Madison 617) TaxID=670483 RepID=S7PYA1_GLOTA|nr:protein prenylyltransferase [Gloeophyllum trabeum ATCC 11539]EPQ52327.1 protein prenylyltransferase [Gloeophyllum trabeum ATCC 11539]